MRMVDDTKNSRNLETDVGNAGGNWLHVTSSTPASRVSDQEYNGVVEHAEIYHCADPDNKGFAG